MSLSAYSSTPASNVAISGISIAEGCNASNMNDAMRQLMADLAVHLASNGSDFPSAATFRTNLGLGSAALSASTAFDASGAAAAVLATSAQKAQNLADLANVATARTNLGLGTAATKATTFFLQAANNFSDLTSVSTAKANIGIAHSDVNLGNPTPGTTPTAVHGIGVMPNLWHAYLKCTTPNLGYSIGDQVLIVNGGSSNNDGVSAFASTTNLSACIGTNGAIIIAASTNTGQFVTAADWDLHVVGIWL